ncbi:hypothetical protein ACP275_08G213300 [Erythranthe tilingii]
MLCSWFANSLDNPFGLTSLILLISKPCGIVSKPVTLSKMVQKFKLWFDLTITKQSGLSIMSYYPQFLGMWENLATLSPLESCQCANGSLILSLFNNLKTYQFLMGLDESYNTLRT